MIYEDFISELYSVASNDDFLNFQKKVLCTQKKLIGVRTPDLRAIAKKYKGKYEEMKDFPDEYYETSFIKLCVAETLSFERLIEELPNLISQMDCWALTDTFKPKAIAKNKDKYLPYLEQQLKSKDEFFQRFALVTLLWNYREDKYLPLIYESCIHADNEKYYVHMASAWLIAEVLVHHYDDGIQFLKKDLLPVKTHNKAIQKARESFRISKEQKEELNCLKRY